MSEETTPAQEVEASAETAKSFTPPATQDDLDRIIARAVKRAHAQHAEDADKAAKYDKLVESQKSELEKANSRAEAAKKELEEYKERERIAVLTRELSEEMGVPASLIRGSDDDELRAHAKALKEELAKSDAVVADDGKRPETTSPGDNAALFAAATEGII